MKILFLDFDGVLNSEKFYVDRHAKITAGERMRDYPLDEFDPQAIERLNRICQTTGAKVVVSSTWRLGGSIKQLQTLLESVGFIGEVVGKTPSMRDNSVFRGNEIHRWISLNEELTGKPHHEFKEYLILDDDGDMLWWQRDNFIKTSFRTGLTEECARKAIEILG